MPTSYAYVCSGCHFDTIAGSRLHSCPHCGAQLTLIKTHVTEDPKEAYVARATEDLVGGLERMLGEPDVDR